MSRGIVRINGNNFLKPCLSIIQAKLKLSNGSQVVHGIQRAAKRIAGVGPRDADTQFGTFGPPSPPRSVTFRDADRLNARRIASHAA